jgi:hypothetical protein
MYNFTFSALRENSVFRARNDHLTNQKFAEEFLDLTKTSFGLSIDNALDVMQSHSPLLKGFLDFKSSLLSLLEYKDFTKIGFMKVGNAYFLRVSYVKQKPFDLIIPLIKGQGRIFRIEFEGKDTLVALESKFYKFTLNKSNWFSLPNEGYQEILTPLKALDFFSTLDLKSKELDPFKAQALYGFYFERFSEVLKNGDEIEYALWKNSVSDISRIMEELAATPQPQESEGPAQKLLKNFKDLKDAVESQNKDYFGLDQPVSI